MVLRSLHRNDCTSNNLCTAFVFKPVISHFILLFSKDLTFFSLRHLDGTPNARDGYRKSADILDASANDLPPAEE